MQPTDDIDPSEALMEVWSLVKPSEAKDLKLMVASADGRFAGIFTCDADQHGDRFFVLKQRPRSGTWTMASNLMSHLDDLAAANLGKSARLSVNEFREILANPSVKYEPAVDHRDPPVDIGSRGRKKIDQPEGKGPSDVTPPGPPAPSVTQAVSRLRGKQLLERAKQLEGRRPEEQARFCGYVIIENGRETGDIEGYYEALYHAHSA